jgi:hypothetical protein
MTAEKTLYVGFLRMRFVKLLSCDEAKLFVAAPPQTRLLSEKGGP